MLNMRQPYIAVLLHSNNPGDAAAAAGVLAVHCLLHALSLRGCGVHACMHQTRAYTFLLDVK
jgi:hypothetical protein